MDRVLPPGLDRSTFEKALTEFNQVVGKQWVFIERKKVDLYRDAYTPLDANDEFYASAAIAPASTEEVQAIVKIANRYKIPLWSISTGKNLAYGGSSPRMTGTIVLDLKRMNKILEVNEELAYVLVEPGVSFFDLHNHLKENHSKLWMSVPSPGWGSVLGNALERGAGYTPYGDHFGQQCGMEVVLADGELMRTGNGAIEGTDSWQQFKYGFGPYVDGLFTQSNYGVVTKMGLWLMPEPEYYTCGMIHVRDEDQLENIVNTLRPFMLDKTIECAPSIYTGTFEAAFRTVRSKYKQGPVPMTKKELRDMYADLGVGWWNIRLSFYGDESTVKHNWEKVRLAFEKLPGVTHEMKEFRTPLTIDELDYNEKLQAGIPNMAEWNVINWGTGLSGHMDFSPTCPLIGSTAMEQYNLFSKMVQDAGYEYVGGFVGRERGLLHIVPLPIIKNMPEVNKQGRKAISAMIDEGAKRGWAAYRSHLFLMDQVAGSYSFNDGAALKFNQTLKDALDPNGIFAPGKQGIWPKAYREAKS
ncbi:FAD-binding oxidoreductase [Amphritea sp.]|uniref:FAD-dependent oxidoreductase n=1 Tax=Amphritea sp. TaxID=1872502 RepID=UPI003A936BAD